ncbi:MAG: ferrous iron transport protein A [Bacteroidia bacterium]|nr:ferrous iron transport protein A [Bacteroidia bacterium]
MDSTLADFRNGEKGRIISFGNADLQVALMNLGVIPGEEFELAHIAPLGDPISILVHGTKIALRKAQAREIIALKF